MTVGRIHLVCAACVLGLACALVFGRAKVAKAPNPHRKADACGECHTMENGKPQPLTAAQADEVCLKCHDGERASAEFHPVGRAFDNKLYTKPAGWPLAGERLGCLTCHDMLSGCNELPKGRVPGRMFLREVRDDRNRVKPFCAACHQDSAYRKINPHEMLLSGKDETIDDKCLFCHTKAMDRKAMRRTGNAELKGTQNTFCRDCHARHKDPMPQQHIGMKLSKDMLATMYVREMLGLNSKLGPKLLEQSKAADSKPTLMIPDADGTISCSTCHNPHQHGVFPAGSVLGFRAMRPRDDGKMVSPVRGKQWCSHCHDF